ncbi:phosphorylase [Anabaena cylindrica UHCC 0172]|uniref:phosphorylase family protein n=1 Tax=Anabaena cylindrica TaxID=1165 RepID=UPI002B1FFE24|nr:phosphorylase [Anabaena cylindrica]MEA5550126.1 phosphorylase [Anabaena cylindrica UHCC 0172]
MHLIHTILVPQGAEYQAVCRGLSRVTGSPPQAIAIPMGMQPLRQFLEKNCQHLNQRVLLMGLCGSLNELYRVGDVVGYRDCVDQENIIRKCDFTYTREIHSQIKGKISFVKGLTSDRIICLAAEKRHLNQKADVVDMEGSTALEFLLPLGASVAMIRVVSDDCLHDIPNLTSAFSEDGSLKPLPLTWALIRQPLAATRLIRGSLQALNVLEKIASRLVTA